MAFQVAEFERLVNAAGGRGHRWKTSSMGAIRTLLQGQPSPQKGRAVVTALEGLATDKKKKYVKAIEYICWEFPFVIPPAPPPGEHPKHLGARIPFHFAHDEMDRGDLLYGLANSRTQHAYAVGQQLQNWSICDQYNNFFGVGTGSAFMNRDPKSKAIYTKTATSVTNHVQGKTVDQDALDGTGRAIGAGNARFAEIYRRGMMASRFSPDSTIGLNKNQVSKDHYTRTHTAENALGEARYYKAIRRACKGGISMIATSPEFRRRGAQVHFILDGYGDLANAAQKKPLNNVLGTQTKADTYVPITSSELCFVNRNWDDLDTVVRFYVNGFEVAPPWEFNWREQDVFNREVHGNWHAWKRYEVRRRILDKDTKGLVQFPDAV